MFLELKNQVFHLDNNITVYHLCNSDRPKEIKTWFGPDVNVVGKLVSICRKALLDPVTIKHCFYVDDYINQPTTLLYQFFTNNLNLVIIESGLFHATIGYTIYGDIVLCPRRVFIDFELRNNQIFTDNVLTPLEEMFVRLGIKYAAITFNKTKQGFAHFRLYGPRSNLRNILTTGGYFDTFTHLAPDAINMFDSEQYVVYKKLNSKLEDISDLTIEKFCNQVK